LGADRRQARAQAVAAALLLRDRVVHRFDGAGGRRLAVLRARAFMGVFAGFSSSAIALVASQVPERRLGYALGWLSTGQLVGSLVGPIIGGVLADISGSYRIPFYCTAATIFVAMGLVWFIVKEEFTRP